VYSFSYIIFEKLEKKLHRPKWLIVESTNRWQSWGLETSAGMVITSGDPSNLALPATSLIRFSLLATSARRAPLLAYSYARCFAKRNQKNPETKPNPSVNYKN